MMKVLYTVFYLASIALSSWAAQQTSSTSVGLSGTTIIVGGVPYFIPPTAVSQLSFDGDPKTRDLVQSVGGKLDGKLIPFTVISTNNSQFGDSAFEETLEVFRSGDDVWNMSFLVGWSKIPLECTLYGKRYLGAHLINRFIRVVQRGISELFDYSIHFAETAGSTVHLAFISLPFRYRDLESSAFGSLFP